MFKDGTKLTAGYLNDKYRQKFGYSHYGHDIIPVSGSWDLICPFDEMRIIHASNSDPYVGGLVVAQMGSHIIRMWHFETVYVNAGQTVKYGQKIAKMGNKGKYTTNAHTHIEVDTDTNYPMYSSSFSGSTKYLKPAKYNTQINPAKIMKYFNKFITANDGYMYSNDNWTKKAKEVKSMKYYAKVDVDLDKQTRYHVANAVYMMKFENEAGAFRDKDLTHKHSTDNFKPGQKVVSKYVGTTTKGGYKYWVHKIDKNQHGVLVYFAYKREEI